MIDLDELLFIRNGNINLIFNKGNPYHDELGRFSSGNKFSSKEEIVDDLDRMGIINSDMSKWLKERGDEEVIKNLATEFSEANSIGLELDNIHVEKKKSGSKLWGQTFTGGRIDIIGKILEGNLEYIGRVKADSYGFHTGDGINYFIRHEIGHLISYQNYNRAHFSDHRDYCASLISRVLGYSSKTTEEVGNELLKELDFSMISRYGRTNVSECIAESYSNPNYSEFTKKVYDILTRDLESYSKIDNRRRKEESLCTGYGPEEEILKNDSLNKLDKIKLYLNGGKGSGNFNPGQGRGIGKPGGGSRSVYKTMLGSANLSEEEKKYAKYWEDYQGEFIALVGQDPLDFDFEFGDTFEDGRTFDEARDYFDSIIRKRKFPEDTTVYRRLQFGTHEDLEKAIERNFIADTPQATSAERNPEYVQGDGINQFELVDKENRVMLKINVKKGQSGLALDNSMEEIILPRYTEFKVIERKQEDDGTTTCVVDYIEHTSKQYNDLMIKKTEEENRLERLNFLLNSLKRGNPYHDKLGRFTAGYEQGVEKSNSEITRQKIEDIFIKYSEFRGGHSSTENVIFDDIVKIAGYDKKPQIFSDDEFDKLVNENEGRDELFRGIEDDSKHSAYEYINELKNGEYFAGDGDFGPGIYLSSSIEYSLDYGMGKAENVVHAILDKSANVKNYEEIKEIATKISTEKSNEYMKKSIKEYGKGNDKLAERYEKLAEKYGTEYTANVYAVENGIDALLNGDVTIVLNRKKLIFRETQMSDDELIENYPWL